MRGSIGKGYQVWGKLSQGGMNDVWLARHGELAIPVVIKTVLASRSDEPFQTRYDRMLSEARLTARLTSPRVVRVIDIGTYVPTEATTDAVPFLVEEYVDGIDLAELDRRRRTALRRPMPLWTVAHHVAQAADGLHAAHQGGVIHCDIKPSNLFGDERSDVKVGDFGVAVAAAAQHSAPAGTPLFMAPEHLLGDAPTRLSDMYSLGATAFALRYGFTPHASPSDAVRSDSVPRFPAASTPEEAYFQNVVAKMMAHRPAARFENLGIARHHLRSLSRSITPRPALARVEPTVFQIGPARVSVELGDLSIVETDAIVNSASSAMTMQRSLSGALRTRGGDELEAEAMAGGERALGECIATGPGKLACKGVLHAVGGWNEVSCVARATHRALLLAEERKYARLAMPAIATGSTGVSVEMCADAMVGVLRAHLVLGGSQLREVRFVLVDAALHKRFLDVASGILLGSEDAFRFEDEFDTPVSSTDATGAPTLFVPGQAMTRTPTEPIR